MDWNATRPGEVEGGATDRVDATLRFIGTLRTPFARREDCPRGAGPDGPICRVEVDAPWQPALLGLAEGQRVELLYWMHLARRDLLVQAPRHRDSGPIGTFALRSPNRPNPVATAIVTVVGVEPGVLLVRGLDCVDGTKLVDIKPDWKR